MSNDKVKCRDVQVVYGRLNEGGCGGRVQGPEVNCLKVVLS